jgi:hypothetical protein
MSFSLDKCIQYSNGAVSLEATLIKCSEAIMSHNETKEHDLEAVADAVRQVFSTYKGSFVNAKALGTMVVGILKPTSLNAIAVLLERTVEYVHAHPETFVVKKARGIAVIADLPVETPKA